MTEPTTGRDLGRAANSAPTLVRGRYVLTRAEHDGSTQLLTDAAVAVSASGVVQETGRYEDLRVRHPLANVVGDGSQFVLPGLVNAHHHGRGVSYLQLGQPDGPLETWIHRAWGRRPMDSYLMGMYTLMQQMRSGTTAVMFNQAGPLSEAEGTLRAFRATGVRTAFSIGFRSQSFLVYGDDDAFLDSLPSSLSYDARRIIQQSRVDFEDYLQLVLRLKDQHERGNPEAIRILLSPSGYHWADEGTLRSIGETARANGMGIHTHVLETVYQRLYAERTRGESPVRRLAEVGLVGPGVSFAHCVWVTEDDIRILAETGTSVSHNPSSNLRLHSGIAPVRALLDAGVNVGLGTDSTSLNDDDDMLQEIGLSQRLHRVPGLNERPVSPGELLHMATLGGAKALTLDHLIGSLEPGKRADMVLLDWDRASHPYLDGELDPLDVLVTRVRGRDVRTVLINGLVVYEDGRFPGLDAESIARQTATALQGGPPPDVLDRRHVARRLEPHIRDFYRDWELPKASNTPCATPESELRHPRAPTRIPTY